MRAVALKDMPSVKVECPTVTPPYEVEPCGDYVAAIDAITNAVFTYKPTEKGLAAKKTKRRIARQVRKEAADDRESSI